MPRTEHPLQDLASYKKEVLAGDADYNLVTVTMSEKSVSLKEAVEDISALCAEVLKDFLLIKEDIIQHQNGMPSWGERIDEHIAMYIEGLGRPRACHAKSSRILTSIQDSGSEASMNGTSSQRGSHCPQTFPRCSSKGG